MDSFQHDLNVIRRIHDRSDFTVTNEETAMTATALEPTPTPLSPDQLANLDAYWRACCYLAVGMIYLRDNPLLKVPLKEEHLKNRLLGHWGASPGLSFMYVHLNRIIKQHDQAAIFLAGPGHGAPGVLAPVYLEGTYSEIYPNKSEDEEGMRAFFKQFSFPGGHRLALHARNPRLHPRGRRARLFHLPCLRCRLR